MRSQTKKRLEYVMDKSSVYESTWGKIERRFLREILSFYTAGFSVKDGKITQSTRNISFARKIQDLQNDFVKNESGPHARTLARSLERINNLNKSYFKSVPGITAAAADKAFENVQKRLSLAIGSAKAGIIKGSYLDDVQKLDRPFLNVKRQALQAASGGVGLDEFRNRIKTYVEDKSAIKRHYRSVSGDIYSQYERDSSNIARQNLDLVFAIYTGGLIGTSRPFCIERNGKVFHVSEIEKFGTPSDTYGGYTDKANGDFQGKNSNKAYDPVVDLGDVNCRHFLNWISNQLAIARRPEVKLLFLNNAA